jgi:DNA-binding beta-propeller fold protein YncE
MMRQELTAIRHFLFMLAVLTALTHLASGTAFAIPHPIFQADPNWPKTMPNGYVFGPSGGVTVDSHDNVWVYSRPTTVRVTLNDPPDAVNGIPAPSVVELSADGRFIQGWGGPLAMSQTELAKFDWPIQEHGIAVDTKGNVWVCGNGRDGKSGKDDDQCLKFTNHGQFLLQIGHSGKSKGSLDTENLGHPSQPVYWAKTNELFISDGYVNRRVYVADADTGKFKRMWGAYGTSPDDTAPRTRTYDPPPKQFNLLHGLTISNDGIVYVAERNSNRVQAFTLEGKFLKEAFVAPNSPQRDFGTAFGVALSGDKRQRFLYVADGHNEKIHVLDRKTLEEIPGSAFGHVGPYPGQFVNIHVMASDSKGNLYVGDGGGRFQKFVYKGMSR